MSVPRRESEVSLADLSPAAITACENPTTRLIVTDGPADAWIEAAVALDGEQARWEVLPLGVSTDLYRREQASALSRLRAWTFASVVEGAQEARDVLRRDVPGFLADLRRHPIEGARTLQDVFQEGEYNTWWFLEISEKSAYRGPFLNRLYYLALIRAVLAHSSFHEVWLCLRDRTLAEAVTNGPVKPLIRELPAGNGAPSLAAAAFLCRYLGNAVGIALRHLSQCMLVRGLGIVRALPSPPRTLLFFSFYPRMWSRPYETGASEWFFGSLPDSFPKSQPVQYGVWLTCSPWEIWRRRRELRAFFRRRTATCLTLFAGLRAIASVLSFAGLWRAVRFLMHWEDRIETTFLGHNVAPLVIEEIRRSLSSREFFRDLLLRRSLDELTRSTALGAVVYRLEFQPFENALLYGSKGRARTVAFQHSLFGRNYLPYFFVPGELSGRWTGADVERAMPVPDLVLTSGSFGRDVMLANGLPAEAVEVCGPVRYSGLGRYLTRQKDRRALRVRLGIDPDAPLLLVASAVSREEAMGLFAALAEGLPLGERVCLIFKSHPALPLDDEFVRLVGSRIGRDRYHILQPGADFYDLLTLAEMVVLTSTTLAIEAALLGVVPIVFDSGAVFDPKAVELDECVGFLVRNAAELREALRSIVTHDASLDTMRSKWPDMINRWFDRLDVDPNTRFIQILQKHGFLDPLYPLGDRSQTSSQVVPF